MNTKYLNINTNWHCKKSGGLFFGFKFKFPCSIFNIPGEKGNLFYWEHTYTSNLLSIGFLFFTVDVEIKYNHKKRAKLLKEL